MSPPPHQKLTFSCNTPDVRLVPAVCRTALVEDLCRGSLEAVSSLYPALRDLQSIRQLENIKPLFSTPFSGVCLKDVCSQWRQQSQLLRDSNFALVEPIMAARSVALHSLMTRAGDPDSAQHIGSMLTDHLMDLCQLAREAGNTQVCVCVCSRLLLGVGARFVKCFCALFSPAGRACCLPDEAACFGGVFGVDPCVVMAARGSPSVLGKGRAGVGSGSPETDYQ